MTEQLAIDQVRGPDQGTLERAAKPLTPNQELAWEYIRGRDGVTADEIGAHLHAHRDTRPHGVDERCEWCAKTGRQTAESKGLKPLVTYRRAPGGRLYIAKNKADRVRAAETVYEPTEAELAASPFAGLEMPGTRGLNSGETS